jgi:glycosyltransferase involved in cell wall biosynthesis
VSIVVVTPAYNAARHVGGVLLRLMALESLALERIVVVNDGSDDDTHERVIALQGKRVPVQLLDRTKNGGYGAAMKDGIDAARETDPEAVACIHADGQYSPEALPFLVQSLRSRGLDLLQGSRIASGTALSGGMPLYKYAANALLNRMENRTLKLSMTDYHSGYLVYGRKALRALPFRSLSDSFDFDLEVIASARARGLRVGEAPVVTHYGDEISHLSPITYGLRVLRVLWNYRRGRYDAT